MKKILPVIILTAFVWGCSKKMTPAKSETSSSNSNSSISNTQTPSTESNLGKTTGTTASSTTVAQVPIENTGATGSKVAPTSITPEAAAAIAGQATYNAKCGRCHGLKVTTDFTADRWASILAVMAPKANLTDTEKGNVYAYVKENSKK